MIEKSEIKMEIIKSNIRYYYSNPNYISSK